MNLWRVAHITTIDMSLVYLLLNQLRSLQTAGYSVTGISSPGKDVATFRDALGGLLRGSDGLRLSAIRTEDARATLVELQKRFAGYEAGVNAILSPRSPAAPRGDARGRRNIATVDDLRRLALALPGAHEVVYRGDPWFNVGKKTFALVANGRPILKLERGHQELLFEIRPETFQPCKVATVNWSYVEIGGLDARGDEPGAPVRQCLAERDRHAPPPPSASAW